MKAIIFSLAMAGTLAGCVVPGATGPGRVAASSSKAAAVQQLEPAGYASSKAGDDRYEITFSGPWMGSRDAVEGGLLYQAALLASQHGSAWFSFLHMPGEAGPLSHPARPSPSFGAAYGHWQPHWSYRTKTGWQPWHPEWGAPFWTDMVNREDVQRVEVHAMIELGHGPFTAVEPTDFDVTAVLRDLRLAGR